MNSRPNAAWSSPDFVKAYQKSADDTNKSWYEHQVNFPDLLSMLPDEADQVLDFGCGTGVFTARLAEVFEQVTGTDNSPAMIEVARKNYPGVNFRLWDEIERKRERNLQHHFFQNGAAFC